MRSAASRHTKALAEAEAARAQAERDADAARAKAIRTSAHSADAAAAARAEAERLAAEELTALAGWLEQSAADLSAFAADKAALEEALAAAEQRAAGAPPPPKLLPPVRGQVYECILSRQVSRHWLPLVRCSMRSLDQFSIIGVTRFQHQMIDDAFYRSIKNCYYSLVRLYWEPIKLIVDAGYLLSNSGPSEEHKQGLAGASAYSNHS